MSTVADAPGLRDRKKLATRARIHREAVALALEHGVDHVTVEGIAAAAEVSARTFFNYFATKEDAFVGADPTTIERLAAAVVARPAGESALTAVRNAFVDHLAALEADEELWRMRRRLAAREPALAARLAGANDRWRARSSTRPTGAAAPTRPGTSGRRWGPGWRWPRCEPPSGRTSRAGSGGPCATGSTRRSRSSTPPERECRRVRHGVGRLPGDGRARGCRRHGIRRGVRSGDAEPASEDEPVLNGVRDEQQQTPR